MPERPRRRIPGSSEPAAAPEQASAQRPHFRRKGETPPPASRANSGWGAVDALATSDFITALKITDEWLLLKFLEARPFDVYRQHWFEGIKGQRGWRCLNEDAKSPCILCDDLGDTPQAANSYFNVAAFLTADQDPTLEVLRAPKGLTTDIKGLNEDPRFEGLTDSKLYVAVRKKVEGEKRTTYQIEIVRARDLKDEWDVEPLSPELIAELSGQCHTEPISNLRELADYKDLIDDLLKQG